MRSSEPFVARADVLVALAGRVAAEPVFVARVDAATAFAARGAAADIFIGFELCFPRARSARMNAEAVGRSRA